MITRTQGGWHSQRGGKDFLRKLLSSLVSATLKLVSWSSLRQESSFNTPAQGFNLFLTLLSTYRKTLFIFSLFLTREKNPFFYWSLCSCVHYDFMIFKVCVCERVRDPTAPNKILLRKILYKPNKYYVTSNQEKIKYGKILWFLSKEKVKEKEKKRKEK